MDPMNSKSRFGIGLWLLLAVVAVSACSSGGSGGSVDSATGTPSSASSSAAPGSSASAASANNSLFGIQDEADDSAPIDSGPSGRPATQAPGPAAAIPVKPSDIPVGDVTANVTGVFGAVVTWPIIPIHAVLLADGRVMNYGTNTKGQQGALLYYDVWDPTLGTGSDAHMMLPNTTPTDIFCGAQSVLASGQVLVAGGDLTVDGVRNFARNDTNIFTPGLTPDTNTLTPNTPMTYPRWYGSLVSLPDGRLVIFGGIQNQTTKTPPVAVTIPELYDPATNAWTVLTGANKPLAFGPSNHNWYYPRAYVAPGGRVFVLTNDGHMFSVSISGVGQATQLAGTTPAGLYDLPTVSYAPGKLLSLRQNALATVVDFTQSVPVVAQTDPIDQLRIYASATVMADGQVLVTGGSLVKNVLTGVAYTAQIWNPTTGHWTAGATAAKPRLYHSNALLLPDATVLTGGGGAPGPVKNLNAEIFYPPYLYAPDGTAATRPLLAAAGPLAVNLGDTISASVGPTDIITRLTFVRTGSATHANNSDQRFIDLPFSQEGQNLSAVLPSDSTVVVPGYYMLFAFNDSGVPSTALMFNVTQIQGH